MGSSTEESEPDHCSKATKKGSRLGLLWKTVISIVCSVALLEGVLWLFFPQGWEPEIDVAYHQDFPGLKKEIRFQKNGLGLRSLTIDRWEKPEKTIRVICIGASTTEQGTQSTEDMWMAHLERLLKAELGGEDIAIQVGAYGKGGSKMHEVMQWCQRDLLRLEPDVVITLFGINSLATDEAIARNSSFDDLVRLIESPPPFWEGSLREYSQISRYMRTARANARLRKYIKEKGGLNFDVQGVAAFRKAYWSTPLDDDFHSRSGRQDLFRERTNYLLRWFLNNGIRPVVLAQPVLLHKDMDYREDKNGRPFLVDAKTTATPEAAARAKQELEAIWFVVNTGDGLVRVPPREFRDEMTLFNQVQKELAGQHGVAYVPLDERIAPNLENFFDDCHFTDLGSRRVAEAIMPELKSVVRELVRQQK